MIKIMAAIAVLLAVAGCARPYSYSADKADPVLIFTSDFYEKTSFFVNFDPSTVNNSSKSLMSIRNFMYVGHTSESEGRRFLGLEYFEPTFSPIKEFTKQVPADQVIVVRAKLFDGEDLYGPICGPVDLPFTPKKGHTYKVNMNAVKVKPAWTTKASYEKEIACYISITDAGDSKSPKIISDSERVR